MSTPLAHLADGPRGERIQAVFLCACGSLDIAARGMCPRCLARQHHDREHFGGHREAVLKRDHWTCQGCFYRPAQEDRDWIVVHHRVPGVSRPALMISLCAACHAIVERLRASADLVASATTDSVARATSGRGVSVALADRVWRGRGRRPRSLSVPCSLQPEGRGAGCYEPGSGSTPESPGRRIATRSSNASCSMA